MRWNLWGVLVGKQLWIFFSKINFEIFHLTQFSIFFEKNKIIGCRFFITTLEPLGLRKIYNSIPRQISILNHFLLFFYLLFFSYMLYNLKWFEFFQAYRELDLKNESKEAPPTWTFFSYKCDLVKFSCHVFHKAKEYIFVNSNANILQSTQWNFLKFFPQLLKPSYYKIKWFDVSKDVSFSKNSFLY